MILAILKTKGKQLLCREIEKHIGRTVRALYIRKLRSFRSWPRSKCIVESEIETSEVQADIGCFRSMHFLLCRL